MTENFPNLEKEINLQAQEAQKVRVKINPKGHTLRHITIKTPKIKEKDLYANQRLAKQHNMDGLKISKVGLR